MPVRKHIQGAGLYHAQTDDGAYHACHQDEQGSTAYITGSNGAAENCYIYDAFGNVLEKKEDVRNRILYTDQQYDQETGQYYLRARVSVGDTIVITGTKPPCNSGRGTKPSRGCQRAMQDFANENNVNILYFMEGDDIPWVFPR